MLWVWVILGLSNAVMLAKNNHVIGLDVSVVKTIDELMRESDIILTNGFDPVLDDVKGKVFSRVCFGGDQ